MKYYVYLYMRADMYSPYYVGKGSGSRATQKGGRNCNPPPAHRIRKVFHTDSEEEALLVEATLIRFYGRKCEGGILHNISEGGNQPPNMKGIPKTEKHKKLMAEASRRNNTAKHMHTPEARRRRAIAAIGNHNRRAPVPCVIEGISYPSQAAAAEATGASRTSIWQWHNKLHKRTDISITYGGVFYKNKTILAKAYGLHPDTCRYRLKNNIPLDKPLTR